MRVLHWYANFAGGGGVATAVETLARAQAELGAEVAVAFAAGRRRRLYAPLPADLALHEWQPARTLSAAGLTLRVLRRADADALRALAPDLVHVHGEFLPDNLRVPRLFDAPLVLSPHGAFHPLVLAKSRARAKAAYVRVAEQQLYRHVTLHALSPAETEHARRLLPGVRTYCVPQAGREPSPAPARSDGTLRLLYAGRLDVFTKGLDVLVDGVAGARARGVDVRLTLAGPDWNGGRAQLERRAAAHGLNGALRFAGELAPREVARALADSDAYAQLSRHEGAPVGVADALAAGKPVVLSAAVGTASDPRVRRLAHVRVVEPTAAAAAEALVELAAAAPESAGKAAFVAPAAVAQAHLDEYARLLGERS